MNERQRRIERMRKVEREYLAAVSAFMLLSERVGSDPSFGESSGWSPGDAHGATENLEATYVIRLFAEFESGLREIWRSERRRTTRPLMEHLLRSMAKGMSPKWVDDAQEVRAFRNRLVHDESAEDVAELTLKDVRSRLCRYFSFQPPNW